MGTGTDLTQGRTAFLRRQVYAEGVFTRFATISAMMLQQPAAAQKWRKYHLWVNGCAHLCCTAHFSACNAQAAFIASCGADTTKTSLHAGQAIVTTQQAYVDTDAYKFCALQDARWCILSGLWLQPS